MTYHNIYDKTGQVVGQTVSLLMIRVEWHIKDYLPFGASFKPSSMVSVLFVDELDAASPMLTRAIVRLFVDKVTPPRGRSSCLPLTTHLLDKGIFAVIGCGSPKMLPKPATSIHFLKIQERNDHNFMKKLYSKAVMAPFHSSDNPGHSRHEEDNKEAWPW